MVIGLAGEREIVSHCDRLLGISRPRVYRDEGARHLLTPRHWAYLRISDGCDRTCAFCAIPGIRGVNRSESIEVLVAEAWRMAAGGVKEIALIAQDTMRYGADLYGSPRLMDLLRELVRVDGLEWIRLLYTYPHRLARRSDRRPGARGKAVRVRSTCPSSTPPMPCSRR